MQYSLTCKLAIFNQERAFLTMIELEFVAVVFFFSERSYNSFGSETKLKTFGDIEQTREGMTLHILSSFVD